MAVKFLFLAFLPSMTLSQPWFPQGSILAEEMLREPWMWTVWAAAKSPSVWLPESCLPLSFPLSLPLGWFQGPIARSRGPTSWHTHGTIHWTLTVINNIVHHLLYHCEEHSTSHGEKIWLSFWVSKIISKIFQNTLRESGTMWLPNPVALCWSFPRWVIRFQIYCLLCKCLVLSDGSCFRHLSY